MDPPFQPPTPSLPDDDDADSGPDLTPETPLRAAAAGPRPVGGAGLRSTSSTFTERRAATPVAATWGGKGGGGDAGRGQSWFLVKGEEK
jgi:hypothetical protein